MTTCSICGKSTGETGNLECSKCFDKILKLNLVSSRDRPDVIFTQKQLNKLRRIKK